MLYKNAQKISIIGCSGSGKSTLAMTGASSHIIKKFHKIKQENVEKQQKSLAKYFKISYN